MNLNVTLDPAERELVLLALAVLSLDRPGWYVACGALAEKFGVPERPGLAMLDEYRRLNADRMSITRELSASSWIFVDGRGDRWRLEPTGKRTMPFVISLVERALVERGQ